MTALWESFEEAASPKPGETLDWVTLLYIGTVILHMPETTFWCSTLRKIHALFACHCKMLGTSNKGRLPD